MTDLLFVDTNIFLDFYRIRRRDAGLSILQKLETHKDVLITTEQVVMEFKKNRQRVLLETQKGLKTPDWSTLALPPILSETKASRALDRHKKALAAHSAKLNKRLEYVLQRPSSYDPVYQAIQRIWKHPSANRLSREKEDAKREVRELAEKRYRLGYPPRKAGDTSFGDAVNWEWLVSRAKETGCGVVIVTRDSDYGASVGGAPVLNDWLREEFRERVSPKRKIVLADRITDGLKSLKIQVTPKEEAATEALGVAPAEAVLAREEKLTTQLMRILGYSPRATLLPGPHASEPNPEADSG